MCNATALAAQAVLDALSNRLKNDSVFTAFDITTDARDGTHEHIAHLDSREIVHNEFDTGEFPDKYNKEEFLALITGHVAICYYPDGKSAEDHPLAVQGSIAAAAPPIGRIPSAIVAAKTAQAAPTTKQGGKTKDGDSFICNVTCDGRVNVPKELYSQVTADGGTFDVQFNGTIIYKKPIGAKDRLVLTKSDLNGGKRFRVGVNFGANTITLEQI